MEGPTRRASEVVVAADPVGLAHAAAERFADIAEEAVARDGRFTVALAGGSTPKGLYSVLATEPYRSRVPWREALVFWGDERCVPPDHADSNYQTATETLLRHVPIPAAQIHRMRGEDPDPDRAAADYEWLLRLTFQRESRLLPRFDLVLLGMGADGHTVSLFPGSPALRESARLVVAPYVARLQTHRLTLTLPVLNGARSIFFLVSGEEKARMLKTVLEAVGRSHEIPSQMIFPSRGTITWFVDSAAAHLLARREASLP